MNQGRPISADYPYESHYIDVLDSRMHYIEQGSGRPILFLHGNPTWSYLWRNIIPLVAPKGRCIAPDLIGMGLSDKPDIDYRFTDHTRYLKGFIEAMGLEDVLLVIHDWGSGLGFHYATQHPDNVRGIAFMEAMVMPFPTWKDFAPSARDIFRAFRRPEIGWELAVNRNVFIEQVLPGAVSRGLTDAEMAQYRRPFLDKETRKPVWQWPREIPIAGRPSEMVEVFETYNKALQGWDVPKLHLWATPGALNREPTVEWVKANLPNTRSVFIGEGIHYVQEDEPFKIGTEIAAWIDEQGL